MSETMASIASVSVGTEGALMPVEAQAQEGAQVREGRRGEHPLSQLRGDDPARS
jgi:hypothetical protein